MGGEAKAKKAVSKKGKRREEKKEEK